MSVYRDFKKTCEETEKRAVCYTKFIDLWQQFHPNVVVAKPMTDLCLICQQNTSKLQRSANLPVREKSECVQIQQEHLNRVQAERELYKRVCHEAKSNFETLEAEIDLDERHQACSLNTTAHYSFDFTQQIHIPSNPMQSGPIYFKTPRKCGIFGVMCEVIPREVNYLIDEASDVSKGANINFISVNFAELSLLLMCMWHETLFLFISINFADSSPRLMCAAQNTNFFYLNHFCLV